MRGYRKWDVRDGRLGELLQPGLAASRPGPGCLRALLPRGPAHSVWDQARPLCGRRLWPARLERPELVGRQHALLSKRIQCWGVVESWGRVVEHEKGFRALYMRPLALSPMFPIDLKLLKDMAAAYEIRLLMSVGDVRGAFPPLTTTALS